MSGLELVCRPINGARLGYVAERKIFFDGQRVGIAREVGAGLERLEFGAENQRAVVEQGPVQWLDAQAIAGQKQGLAAAVVDCIGKHAAQTLDACLAPFLPGVHEHLGIAIGAQGMAAGAQFLAQFLKVVYLAIEDHRDRAVLVMQRLAGTLEVDDRQSPMPERDAGALVDAIGIGAAMGEAMGHRLDGVREVALGAGIEHSGNAAHRLSLC